MKTYVVHDSGYNIMKSIDEKTPRLACIDFLKRVYGYCNPRLSKMFVDKQDAVYHVGYVCGNHWLSVGEYIPFEIKE